MDEIVHPSLRKDTKATTSGLSEEIQLTRRKIEREGLDMSIGELASLYERGELVISPPYQRLFRWEEAQKTRFIESIFLNIPMPPIFVYTMADGKWELVDGLQRVSTCLQFMGKLPGMPNFVCSGTNLVPSFADVFWPSDSKAKEANALPLDLQLNFRRSRLRVEVLGPDTDSEVRYEVFQRLNSGGTRLSEQEVRSCIIYSVNPEAYELLRTLADDPDLSACYEPTDRQKEEQQVVELVVRTICLRHVNYDRRKDVHEYLNNAIVQIAKNAAFDWQRESAIMRKTFSYIHTQMGDKAFWRGNSRLLGLYEFVSLGTSKLIERGEPSAADNEKFKLRYERLLKDRDLERYTKGGVRGTDRWRNFVTKRGYDYFTK